MKILMLSDVYFPRINGVSTSIRHFRQELRRLGHEVWLIAPAYEGEVDDDPAIIRVPAAVVPFDPEDRIMSTRRIRRLLPRLQRQDFDVVHVHTPFSAHYAGSWLAQRLGIPCVVSYHTFFEAYGSHYLPWVPGRLMRAATQWLSRRQCNSVERVIAPSRAMADALARYGVRTPIEIIPTGIELEEMARGDGAAFRARLGIAPDEPTLVSIGRVAHEKNIGFLLSAVDRIRAELPAVKCLIAGAGPAAGWLREEVRRRGLSANVVLVGNLSRQGELQSCYRAGDVFIFASRSETQGLVLLEAMAAGVPVVALADNGTVDILEAERGCRVAANDVDDFADKTLQLLRDDELRRELGREAQLYARYWSAPALTARLLDFYRRLLDQRGQRSLPNRQVAG